MYVWDFTLNKMKGLVLESTEDRSDYFGTYPIVWDKTEIWSYEELVASDFPTVTDMTGTYYPTAMSYATPF